MPYAKAHAPIYGYLKGARHTIPLHLVHYARTVSILKLLAGLRFGSVLNVGGADGMQSRLIADLFGVPVATADLNPDYLKAGNRTFGLPCVCANGQQLPFADDSFDLALCVETVEHVADPGELCAELTRVARGHVVLSTESFFESPEQRTQFLTYIRETHPQFFRSRNPIQPADKHHFTREDLQALFPGCPVSFRPQFERKRREIDAPIGEVRELVRAMTEVEEPGRAARVIVHADLGGGERTAALSEDDILARVVRDEPMLPLTMDEAMRREDDQAREAVRQWWRRRSTATLVRPSQAPAQEITEPGASGMRLTWLTRDEDDASPPFCLRRVELDPGGQTPARSVSWERQLYILGGVGTLRLEKSPELALAPGDCVRIPPGVEHAVLNTGDGTLEFLDVVESVTAHFGR